MLLSNGEIYLDYNATTPIDPRVLEAMDPYLRQEFGNPSSSHSLGRRSHEAVENARLQLAALLRCHPEEIIFTSGGSESNNLALKGTIAAYGKQGSHIILSAIEHPAIRVVGEYLIQHGFRVSYLPVNENGVVNPSDLEEIITSRTLLVSVMHANNEVGSIQPIRALSEISHAAGAVFHTDAAQSVGKIETQVPELGCDLLSIAGHKLYAPKGVGALYKKETLQLKSLIHGADHENGQRAGTENVAGIVGLGKAAEIANHTLAEETLRLSSLRDMLQHRLKTAFPFMRINGLQTERLPNTLNVSFRQLHALDILADLDHVLISAGAACHSGQEKGSGVLEAMHVPVDYQLGTLRISLGRFCDEVLIEQAAIILIDRINFLLEQ